MPAGKIVGNSGRSAESKSGDDRNTVNVRWSPAREFLTMSVTFRLRALFLLVESNSKIMKAFARNGYGSADAYELIDAAKPVPSKNEVLVKVVATAVNDWEWGMLKAPWPVRLFIGPSRPRGKHHVMGCDMAGRVEAVGRHSTRGRTGAAGHPVSA